MRPIPGTITDPAATRGRLQRDRELHPDDRRALKDIVARTQVVSDERLRRWLSTRRELESVKAALAEEQARRLELEHDNRNLHAAATLAIEAAKLAREQALREHVLREDAERRSSWVVCEPAPVW